MEALERICREHPRTILFSSAAGLRILLAITFPALPDILTGRVEISTPVNSFKRLQEGLFLYERGLDPYNGGIFHQAPLLLPVFSLLPSPGSGFGRLISVALYTLLDIGSASLLYAIASVAPAAQSRLYSSPRKAKLWSASSVAAVYLFNPYTLLTCLGRSTTVFTTFFTLLSINHACQAKTATSAFALAIAGYISLQPALLLPPIGAFCFDRLHQKASSSNAEMAVETSASTNVSVDQRTLPNGFNFALQYIGSFLSSIVLLFGLSRALLPSWQFLPSVYLTPLQLPDLTPNTGLWWYFFIEMFDPFRSFFLGVFWLHMASYAVPFSLRMKRQPLAAVVAMMGILAVFEPYANVGSAGTWLSALTLLSHTFELSSMHRYPFPALATLLYGTLLGPAFHYLWIYAGSGNANFFYAITLVWNLGLLILLTDLVYAVLRDEWEDERSKMDEPWNDVKGKEVRQI